MVDSASPVPQFVTTGVRVHSKLDKLGYHHQRNIIVTVILVIFYFKPHCYLGASIQSKIMFFFSPKMETAMVYLKSVGELLAVLPHKWSFSLGLDPASD